MNNAFLKKYDFRPIKYYPYFADNKASSNYLKFQKL